MSLMGELLKGGVAFCVARSIRSLAVGTLKAREEGCIGRNGLTKGSNGLT